MAKSLGIFSTSITGKGLSRALPYGMRSSGFIYELFRKQKNIRYFRIFGEGEAVNAGLAVNCWRALLTMVLVFSLFEKNSHQ